MLQALNRNKLRLSLPEGSDVAEAQGFQIFVREAEMVRHVLRIVGVGSCGDDLAA